ncbi:aminoglycoside phosphotransferase [Streptomyces tsukubensis]|uniref:Aminoglycoside phosphotransferase n=1 Tax=Streptomyces tsukubensis TaxID=83656 RepID=A0A1V4AA77_9ACTN|nr:aminoglycoside phosphotransferase [Streptomyces tsukubensis]
MALGENAVFASGDLVVKVGRAPELLERARLSLRIADWLEESGVPAVRSAQSEPQLVDGHPVTVWHRLPQAARPPEPADLAGLLRLVHALPLPVFAPPHEASGGGQAEADLTAYPSAEADGATHPAAGAGETATTDAPPPGAATRPALPRRELLSGVERWLRLAGDAIDPADADFLRERRDGFAPAAAALVPELRPGPIHGDALPRNVLVGPEGPVLADLETFSADLREHDLVVMALSRDRYGLPAEAYDSFTRSYGWDVREWEGCEVLRGARETASCAWVAQHAPANPKALTEFQRRVASLRDGDPTVRWYPF